MRRMRLNERGPWVISSLLLFVNAFSRLLFIDAFSGSSLGETIVTIGMINAVALIVCLASRRHPGPIAGSVLLATMALDAYSFNSDWSFGGVFLPVSVAIMITLLLLLSLNRKRKISGTA